MPLLWRVARVNVWAYVRDWAGIHPRCTGECECLHVPVANATSVVVLGLGERLINNEGAKYGFVGPTVPLGSWDKE